MADRTTQVLAFVGAPAAGKTEAATVAREMGIPVVTMGDVIRDELRKRGLSVTDENAGRIAQELRAREGLDAIAKRCIPLIRGIEARGSGKRIIVIDGIRGNAEVERFKKEFGTNFLLIRIDAPFNLRYERMRRRGRGDDLLSLEGFKEREERENRWGMADAMAKADRVIRNEGSLEEFRGAIKSILKSL